MNIVIVVRVCGQSVIVYVVIVMIVIVYVGIAVMILILCCHRSCYDTITTKQNNSATMLTLGLTLQRCRVKLYFQDGLTTTKEPTPHRCGAGSHHMNIKTTSATLRRLFLYLTRSN